MLAWTSSGFGFSNCFLVLKTGFVFVSDDQKRVRKVAVNISAITNNVAYIDDGLQGHAFVVTAGSPYLTDSATIKVIR